jgi:NADH-quinone oxidoreductase subunit N
MFVGLGFKVSSAPFHIWAPDVYEGAPAPVVGLMSTGPKAAAFAVLLRVLTETNAPGRFWLLWISAALSMTLGNIGALVQDNIKRLLAYSSIAHAGYLLAAFAVVTHFANAGEKYVTLDDYAGLGRKSPVLAAAFTFFLMSLIGIPITGGFFAKFYVLTATLHSNLVGLTIILVLNSAVGAYYYLRIIVMMYMREPRGEVPVTRIPAAAALAIALCVLATLYLGIAPGRVLDYTTRSARELMSDTATPMVALSPATTKP